jgi:glycerophosphoryl diester phosphodiesterase
MARAKAEDRPIVLWHEERPTVIREIMLKDVVGVCSNRPELLVPYASSPARPSGLPKGPEVVCHRGINKLAPENTLEAARLVFEQGFDWLELDVHQTADDQLVVIHDATLERTTNGAGLVADKTLAALRSLDAGSWFSPKYQGAVLPTLAEAIDLALEWNKSIYIELKKADPALVLELVREKAFLDHCFFWSFDWGQIEALLALEPKANIMVRTLDHPSLDTLFEKTSPAIVEVNINEDICDEIEQIRARGAKAMLCYMGDDIATMEHIVSLAPDMVNLDNPHLWKEVWQRSLMALGGKTVSA